MYVTSTTPTKRGMLMSSSDAAFREKFMKLMQSRKEMSPEQLTSEDEFDNMVELGDATE